MIQFRILGPVEAREDGQALDIGSPKQRALLAVLLLRAGELASVDELIDALWGAHPPDRAVSSVHAYVSRLRKVLGLDDDAVGIALSPEVPESIRRKVAGAEAAFRNRVK